MAAKQIFERFIGSFVDKKRVGSMVMMFGSRRNGEPVYQHVNIDEQVQEPMLALISSGLKRQSPYRCKKRGYVRYSPGYKPDNHELLYVNKRMKTRYACVTEIIDKVSSPIHLPLYRRSKKFISKMFCVVYRLEFSKNDVAYIVNRYNKGRELQTSKIMGIWKRGRVYDIMNKSIYFIGDEIDAICYRNHLFFKSEYNYQLLFESMSDDIRKLPAVSVDLHHLLIDPKSFLKACNEDAVLKRKLARLKYNKRLTDLKVDGVKKIYEALKGKGTLGLHGPKKTRRIDHNLSTIKDPKDIGSRLPADIGVLLKIFNDDFLESDLTEITYEANSKKIVLRKK
ncbi:MAG: hypothetical protein GY841_23045 [FCB group bacterium]|nr:hypothetical protein [FCB group bacterium]